MKKYFIFFAVLPVIAAACSQKDVLPAEEPQEQIIQEEEQQPAATVVYIEAKGDDTKAAISGTDGSFSWSAGDQIAVYAGGYKLSDGLATGGAASATFAFSGDNVLNEADRADFAVFPASLVFDGTSVRSGSASNHSASALTVTLPASYNLADVQGDNFPVPMIAANAPNGGLAFKNICALLRVTVNNVPKDTRRIEFDFGGKKVQGEFTLTGVTAGETAAVTSSTAGADDIITVLTPGFDTFGNLTVSLPVPTGVASSQEYTDVVITSYDAATGGHKINAITTPVKASGAWVPGRTSARRLTANLPVFSVAADKKVVFAPGNLQATLSEAVYTVTKSGSSDLGTQFWGASAWAFAANQYTAIGNTAANTLANPATGDIVDLYSWVGESITQKTWWQDGCKYGILKVVRTGGTSTFCGSTYGEALVYDWGQIMDSVPAEAYHLLSNAEWGYLLSTRTVSDNYVKVVLDNSINGLIIFPDQYTHPLGTSFSNENTADASFSTNAISLEDWVKLENAGCVFLPATGTRDYSSGNVILNEDDLFYWSSTSRPSKSAQIYALQVTDSALNASALLARYTGCAVRLVRDVN